jgi:hypothetical protein
MIKVVAMPEPKPPKVETPFERFKRLTSRLVSVPHAEIRKRETEWKNGRKQHKSHHRHREIIGKLATNDQRKGKMAFIKAYDLLPENSCLFVRLLSKIRNTAVHNAKSFDLDLTKYVAELVPKKARDEWKKAFSSWWVPFPDPQHEAAGKREFESALDNPRHSIFSSCIFILAKAQAQEMNSEAGRNLQNELKSFSQAARDRRRHR